MLGLNTTTHKNQHLRFRRNAQPAATRAKPKGLIRKLLGAAVKAITRKLNQ